MTVSTVRNSLSLDCLPFLLFYLLILLLKYFGLCKEPLQDFFHVFAICDFGKLQEFEHLVNMGLDLNHLRDWVSCLIGRLYSLFVVKASNLGNFGGDLPVSLLVHQIFTTFGSLHFEVVLFVVDLF